MDIKLEKLKETIKDAVSFTIDHENGNQTVYPIARLKHVIALAEQGCVPAENVKDPQ